MDPIIPAQHPLLISPLLSCNLLPTLPFLHGDLPSSPLCPVPQLTRCLALVVSDMLTVGQAQRGPCMALLHRGRSPMRPQGHPS